MSKATVAVAAGTLVALVAATLWVPVTYRSMPTFVTNIGAFAADFRRHRHAPGLHLVPVWRALGPSLRVGPPPWQHYPAGRGHELTWDEPLIHWGWLGGELAATLIAGGLLAVVLRARAARGAR